MSGISHFNIVKPLVSVFLFLCIEVVTRHRAFVVDTGCNDDLVEFVLAVSHKWDTVAEVNAEHPHKLLIVHFTDLIHMSLEGIQPFLGSVGVMQAHIFDVLDTHVEFRKALADLHQCRGVNAREYMLVAEGEVASGFQLPNGVEDERAIRLK